MSKGKGMGFLWAIVFALVSFFVIFLLMPEKSQQFFGTSIGRKGSKQVTKAVDKVSDAVSSVDLETVIKGK